MPDPDPIGPDGTVRLRCYLPHAHIHWLSLGCGRCGRERPLSFPAAIAIMGSGEATIGELVRRLKCRECGGRVEAVIAADERVPAYPAAGRAAA
jgi:hypothetical protein